MNVLKKYHLTPSQWYFYGDWPQPPFSASFWTQWYDKEIADQLHLPLLNGGLIMLMGNTIVNRKDKASLETQIRKEVVQKRSSFFQNLSKVSKVVFDNHRKLVPKLVAAKKSDFNLLNEFIASAKKVTTIWWLSVVYSDFIGDYFVERATKSGVSANDALSAIPKTEALMIRQHREALLIKNELQRQDILHSGINTVAKHRSIYAKIKKHVQEYDWIGTHHYWGEGMTIESFLDEISLFAELEKGKRIEKFPNHLQHLASIAGRLMYIRQYSPEIYGLVAFKARPFLSLTATSIGRSYNDLLLMTNNEVLNCVQGHKELNIPKTRGELFCIIYQDNTEIVIDKPDEIKELLNALLEKNADVKQELKGMVAQKGKASGEVKIFLVPKNLEKMNRGDILVTPMTTPDFIPLMKKAVAIVTDTGGLLSHAAIVSRELGIPCIIGTKVATKVLKDGDKVEVDATKGIVKKL